MRKYKSYPVRDRNSLQYWYRFVSPFRVAFNFVLILIAKYLPSLTMKIWFYRALGMRVGNDVSVGLAVTFDVFFPEKISIGDNSIIGFNATVLTHEALIDEMRIGPTVIGRNVMIGANCTLLAGVTIGDGAVVSAMTLVNDDVPPGAMVGGVPFRILRSSRPQVEQNESATTGDQ